MIEHPDPSHSSASVETSHSAQAWLDDYGPYLFGFAKSRVRKEDVAEDLVQETLLAAWRGRDQFQGRSQTKSWLVSILKRKIIDWLRQQVKESSQSALETDSWFDGQFRKNGTWKSPPAIWNKHAPSARIEQEEFWVVFQSCAEKLPSRLRDTFHLIYLEEQNIDDICQTIGVQRSNLWVMMHRARQRMWRCLSKHWYENDSEPEGSDA